MIEDTLTKFSNRRRLWMSARHPFYEKDLQFKVWYAAAMMMQARRVPQGNAMENHELQRLLYPGLGLTEQAIGDVIRCSRQENEVIEVICEQVQKTDGKAIFLMDLFNVSYVNGQVDEEAMEWIDLWMRMLGCYDPSYSSLQNYITAVREGAQERVAHLASVIQKDFTLTAKELSYYQMPTHKRQIHAEDLPSTGTLHVTEQCDIVEDLVLKKGMRLCLEHARVNLYGNISLEGGALEMVESSLIRMSSSHRAAVNVHRVESLVTVTNCTIDCRNRGMFLRAENGQAVVQNTTITNTTRGAAVRFWGQKLHIKDSKFFHCYSADDGGAIMGRGGQIAIDQCHFFDCEAQKGGAIYAVAGTKIRRCTFVQCIVGEYGGAVYYEGVIGNRVTNCSYEKCYPYGTEIIQHLQAGDEIPKGGIRITDGWKNGWSTILDCPLEIESRGSVQIQGGIWYLHYPIVCHGTMQCENTKFYCGNLEQGDMIRFDHAKNSRIKGCVFDGMLRVGAISAVGTRLQVKDSVFCNTQGGRAVYDAYASEFRDCVFNFCQGGALYLQGGTVTGCKFVNCRAQNGAGIQMYGSLSGEITGCSFWRCVAEYRAGAIDKGIGHRIRQCEYQDCQPRS